MLQLPAKNGGTIFLAERGETGNPNGRPPKIYTRFKNIGYSLPEINQTIQTLFALNPSELAELIEKSDATNLEIGVARAIQNTTKTGDLTEFERMFSRAYGKPKESITIETTPLQFKLDVFAQFYAIMIKLCSQTPLTPETALELIRTASQPLNLDIAEVEEKTREYLGESAGLLGVDTLANGE